MKFTHIEFSIEDHIGIVTLNRPKALNALNKATMQDLNILMDEVDSNEVHGIIITGAGEKAFAAGADITEFLSLSESDTVEMAQKGHDIFNKIENSTIPVIAAVNGFSLGAGCELAMACHLRIASENAKFGQPEINLGLLPGYAGSQRLCRYVGKTKAMELLLTADMINAAVALALGLVNEVVAPAELLNESKKIMRKIISKGPISIAETIRAVNNYYDPNVDGFKDEVATFGRLMKMDEAKEGIQAFLEKRKPSFR